MDLPRSPCRSGRHVWLWPGEGASRWTRLDLPAIANGTANTVWVIPAELSKAMQALGQAFGGGTDDISAS